MKFPTIWYWWVKPAAGNHWYRSGCLKSLNRTEYIAFIHCPAKNLETIYQGADMFVLPLVYEGFGLPVLEALLAGIPTVISHRASLPEVGGDCAIYFDENDPCVLAEKIKELISLSTEGRALLRQCGMEWVKKFSWKGSAQGTIAELKRAALGQHGRNH